MIKLEKKLQKHIHILQFIDSARCMVSSLSNLVNNLSERLHRIKCKSQHDKNLKYVELNISIGHVFFEYANFKDDLINCNCLS